MQGLNITVLFFLALAAVTVAALLFMPINVLFLWAAVGGVVLAVMSFYYPMVILCCLVLATYVQEVWFVEVEGLASLNQMLGLWLCVPAGLRAFQSGRSRLLFRQVPIALVLLYLYLLFSYTYFSFHTKAAESTVSAYGRALVYFMLSLLVLENRRDLLWITGAYTLGALIVTISGQIWNAVARPVNYFGNSGTSRSGVTGYVPHYIEFAIRAMIPLPALLTLLIGGIISNWKKGLLAALVVFFSIAVLVSGSRGALVSYAFMTAMVVMVSGVSTRAKVTAVCLAGALFLLLPNEDLWESLFKLLSGRASDASGQLRRGYLAIILDFSKYSLGDFILGHGLETFRDFYSGTFNPPHSEWSQVFFELGLVGLWLQSYIVYVTARSLISVSRVKKSDLGDGNLKSLVMGWGIAVCVLFFWGLYENLGLMLGSKHLFIALGIFLASVDIVETGLRSRSQPGPYRSPHRLVRQAPSRLADQFPS